MKIDEVYDSGKIKDGCIEPYQGIIDSLCRLEELFKDKSFHKGDDLSQQDLSRYRKLKMELVQRIVDIVKKTEEEFRYHEIEAIWGQGEFWQEIKARVFRDTNSFLKMKPLRIIEESKRQSYLTEIFEVIYFEKENLEYAQEKLKAEREIMRLFFQIINYCEKLLFGQMLSFRRFSGILQDNLGLPCEDSSLLFNLFEQNRDKTEKAAFINRFNNLEYKILKLESQVNDFDDRLDSVYYFIQEFLDCEEDHSDDI